MEIKLGAQDSVIAAKFIGECDGYAAGVRAAMESAKVMFIRHLQQNPSGLQLEPEKQAINGKAAEAQ